MKNIYALILIAASVGIFFGYVRPTWSQISDLRAEEQTYTEASERVTTLKSTLDRHLVAVNGISAQDIERLNKLLPNTVDNVKLIIDINNSAGAQGLAIQNINIAEPKDEGSRTTNTTNRAGYDSIDLSFSVTASYTQFLGFMSSLEKSLRLVDVIRVTFEPGNIGETYNFSVTIRTYWLK
jgi:Tfp pilus assembly protein PilO